MAEITIDATFEDGIFSFDEVYSQARSGSGSTLALSGSTVIGQILTGITYYCYESFLLFPIADYLPPTAIVSAVVLKMWLTNNEANGETFILRASEHDWGATLTTGDFVAGASFPSANATLGLSGIGAEGAYKSFTSDGSEMVTIVQNHVDNETSLRMIVFSSHQAANVAPDEPEFVSMNEEGTHPAQLVITYTIPPTLQSVSGTMGALTGSVSKQANKTLAGVAGSMSGAVSTLRVTLLNVGGFISDLAGGLQPFVINKSLGGEINPAGAMGKTMYQVLAGTFTMSGSLLRRRIIFGLKKIRTISGIMIGNRSKSGKVIRE